MAVSDWFLVLGAAVFLAELFYLWLSDRAISKKPKYGLNIALAEKSDRADYGDVNRVIRGDMASIPGTRNKELLKFEYGETQKMLEHYDNLNWEVGSILVGSSIISMGFVAQANNAFIVVGAALGGMISLFIWVLWIYRHTAIYNVKYDRIYMIEQMLGLAQHRMVGYASLKKVNWLGAKQLSVTGIALLLWVGLSFVWFMILASAVA